MDMEHSPKLPADKIPSNRDHLVPASCQKLTIHVNHGSTRSKPTRHTQSAFCGQCGAILSTRGNPKEISGNDFVRVYNPQFRYTKLQLCSLISKYKYMEANLLNRKKSLESKIPEIRKTLDVVEYLMLNQDSTEPITTQYELNDSLYATAKIKNPKTVNLWLGANVMLEYTTSEAQDLLSSKLGSAKVSLEQVDEDLEFLREQITTMEVNTARVYNYDVKLRRMKKETGGKE